MIVETPAIIIRTYPYSETSVVAKCFTRELGKVGLMVHGAKSSKSPRAAHFQPLSYLNIIFNYKQGRGLQTVQKSDFVEIWSDIQNDLNRISIALAALELTDKAMTDEDPQPDLFDELINVLGVINKRSSSLNLVFWYFVIRLLTILGFRPGINNDTFHGIAFPDLDKGIKSREIMEMLLNSNLESLGEMKVDPQDRKLIHGYLMTHLRYHFEGMDELKTFKVLRSMVR